MALSIKDPEADRLARALAARTGETLTETVLRALRERLVREEGKAGTASLRRELEILRKRCASLPILDDRHPDELVGYDEHGLPR